MHEKSSIKQNILQFLDLNGISKYQFYKETGITRGVLDSNGGMSEDNTAKFIACYPNVNVEWLLTGEGSMLKDDAIKNNSILNVGDGNISNMGSGSASGSIHLNSNQELLNRNSELEKRIELLEKALADKDSIIDNLKFIIENMRK